MRGICAFFGEQKTFFFGDRSLKNSRHLRTAQRFKSSGMNLDRDRLVGRTQVSQSKVNDKCNLSHGSTISTTWISTPPLSKSLV